MQPTVSSLRRLDLYRRHSPALLRFAVVANLVVALLVGTEAPFVALFFAGITLVVCLKRAAALRAGGDSPTEEQAVAYHHGAIVSFSIYGLVLAGVTLAVRDAAPVIVLGMGILSIAVASITAVALSAVTPRSGLLILPAIVSLAFVLILSDPLSGSILTLLLACVAYTLRNVGRQAAIQQEEAELASAAAHATARRVRAELDEYLAASEEWAFELNEHLVFTFVSQNYSNWTEFEGSHEALIGRSLPEVIGHFTDKGRRTNASTDAIQRAIQNHEVIRGHVMEVYAAQKGGRVFKSISARPIFATDGKHRKFAGYRGWGVDVTEQEEARIALNAANDLLEEKVRERTEELEQARLRAVASEQAKSQFLANMSHEIRSPMNGVLGMAEVIERDALRIAAEATGEAAASAAELATRARQIAASGDSLVTVINDILDFSKIEAGRMDLTAAPFDLTALLNAAAALWQAAAERKGLRFVLDAPDTPVVVLGDADRLRQVLENIVGNALKFTETGSVTITARTVRQGDRFTINLSVADTGPGVPEAERERIFGRFDMVDASYTRRAGGTGLGLTIARQLVGMMGGRIIVKDADGGGALFCVSVSLPHATLDVAPDVTGRLHRSVERVLIVDDMPVNQSILKAHHAPYPVEIELASNGREAVDLAKATPFDVIYMDVQMPVMDGYEATKTIRRHEAESGHRPAYIVLTSAHAFAEAINEAHEAGMNDVITKPIRRQDLEALLGPAPAKTGRKASSRTQAAIPAERQSG